MHRTSISIFNTLFNTEVPRIILKADPDFTIQDYNEAYQIATYTAGKDIRGKSLWEVYDPKESGIAGTNLLLQALNRAVKENVAVFMPPFHYDIPAADGQGTVKSWWQLEIIPIPGEDGAPEFLLTTTYNITETVLNKEALEQVTLSEQQLNEELATSNEELAAINEELSSTIEELTAAQDNLFQINTKLESRVTERTKALSDTESSLRSLVMSAHYPLMILRGREWVIEIANQPLVNLWDKTITGVTGRPLMEILPEIEDQPFPGFLRQVYDSGIGYGQEEQIFHYNSPDGPATKYVSFYYDPMFDNEGQVCGIIVAADDITEKVRSRQLLEQSYRDQKELNNRISTINEELAATNEELSASNEELVNSKRELELNIKNLAESEARFRSLITQAPVGICVIRASDLMIMDVNNNYLELVGKPIAEMQNRTIWEAVPEAAANYAPLMNTVITTGEVFIATEHELTLIRNGVPERVFIDFVYEPVKDASGSVNSIMVVGIDVSDKVLSRKNIADIEERIRLAVEAAEIGTFDHDIINDTIVASERFDAIFGFEGPGSRNDVLNSFHPDDKAMSDAAREEAYRSGKMYYDTRLIYPDGSIHWVRINGRVYHDEAEKPIRVLGTVLDITEFKRLQQQKDDFISIASHELRTPLTSLKASLQLLERVKDKPQATMVPRLIEQSSRSMNKISDLVDDLLNVSHMNEGQAKLNKSLFTISTMLNDCCTHVRAMGNYNLIFEGDHELKVFADEHRIDQVVVNFVNNAVKYAPDSLEIYLKVEKRGDMVRIEVRDSGPGIPAEKIPHLFDRYYRAGNTEMQISGLGLGLYISAEIIKRHGGEIGVDSELSKGSTFWFTLPLEGND